MFKRFAVIAALTLASAMAFALPKPSEVKAAIASGNYAKAESMLLEVVKERPTARVHYDLAQVYTYEGKHNQALSAYRQAQLLDPTLKFASTPGEFMKRLGEAQERVAPPPVVAKTTPPPQVSFPVLPINKEPVVQQSESSVFPVILIILLIGGIAAGAFFVITNRRDKKREEDSITNAKREKSATLLGFSKSLEDATLIAKTATYDSVQKRQILDRIATLQIQTRSMLADLKDGKEISASRLNTLELNVKQAVDFSANGTPPAPPVVPAREHSVDVAPAPYFPEPKETFIPVPAVPRPKIRETYKPAPAPRTRTVHHHYTPPPAPAPTSSGSDLLTGVVLGSMMNSGHTRERIIEREATRPTYDSPRYERDTYEAPSPAPSYYSPSPAPSYDSGSDSSDSYESPSPAPSYDSGSDSSDSYESPSPAPSVDSSSSSSDDNY